MARAKRPDHITVPVDTSRGMWTGGDVGTAPRGFCSSVRNQYRKAGRWKARPQFTYDDRSGVRALANWYDGATGKLRLVSVASGNIQVKSATAETWGSTLTGASPTTLIADFVDFLGSLYVATANSTYTPLLPGGGNAWRYTGGATAEILSLSATQPRSLAPFISRMFYGGMELNVSNPLGGTDTTYDSAAYDPSRWTLTNASTTKSVDGTATLWRIIPTNATTASAAIGGPSLASGSSVVWTTRLRGTSYTYSMPMTVSIVAVKARQNSTAYVVGDCVVVSGYIHRCTTAGTSAGAPPAFSTTIGGTTTDGGVLVWTVEQTETLTETLFTVPDRSAGDDVTAVTLSATVPPWATSLGTSLELTFGQGGAAFTLAALEFGYDDGLADGTPTKANWGQQYTASSDGTFEYPFFNLKPRTDYAAGSDQSARDTVYWSGVNRPTDIAAAQSYRLRGGRPGHITAIREIGGRLCVFKRNCVQAFGATDDSDNPILPEGEAKVGFGTLNPKSLDVWQDFAYFVSEDEVYRWRPGMDEPVPLCGDAMRESMFSKSTSTWVESQSAPANRALLTIDQKNRLLLCYVQKSKIHVKSLDSKPGEGWSYFDVSDGEQICDMIYNPTTFNVYCAFTTADAGTAGLARLDPTQTTAQDSISTSGASAVVWDIVTRTLELGQDITVELARIYDNITDSQASQTYTVSCSQDGGNTYSTSNQVEIDPEAVGSQYKPHEVAICQTGGQMILKFSHSGKGGEANGDVSRIELDIQSQGDRYQLDNVIAGSASL